MNTEQTVGAKAKYIHCHSLQILLCLSEVVVGATLPRVQQLLGLILGGKTSTR